MGLRTATIGTELRAQGRTREQWRAQVDWTLAEAARAIRARRLGAIAKIFAEVARWENPPRAYQAQRQLVELVMGAGAPLSVAQWASLYATTAEALVEALEAEPREPVLLNLLGVTLYELVEFPGARACFEAAARLDPELEHVEHNLAELARREGQAQRAPLPKALKLRMQALGKRAKRIADRARPAQGMTLSLCMIVKDEEEMLPGCLAAVKDAVDEIVIIDTGSTDSTVQIAESFGARVIDFPWNGSFADARNVSLEHATGDWVLYLDADEHLVPEDAPLLRELLGQTWREAFYLVETNYTGGDESGQAVTHLALRLFRNRPQYRFEGRIHEQKTQSMPTFVPERFGMTTIRVRHYGYLKGRLLAKDKSRRNIELLEREAREAPSPFTDFNLGSEHLALGDWAASRRYLDRAWNAARQLEGWEAIPYVPLLVARVARARREAGDLEAAREAIEEGLDAFPDHTDLVLEEAVCARDAGDLDGAAERAGRCLEMGDAPFNYAATIGSGTFIALTLLGDVRAAQQRLDEAEELYRRSLAEHPDFVAPILPLVAAMLERGASPEEVERSVPCGRPSAMMLLATGCYEAGRFEVAERWFGAVLERQPTNGAARIGLVETLLSQRRHREAAEEAAREPEDSPLSGIAALAELFAHAVEGDAERLELALERAARAGVRAPELELYRAWCALLAGREAPPTLSAASAASAVTALEALLRVQEFKAFEQLLSLWERTGVDRRERDEVLAQVYLRRGYLESAADVWIDAAQRSADARALIGLGQVALARELPEDALVFAVEAFALDPGLPEARRLHDAIVERLVRAAVPAA